MNINFEKLADEIANNWINHCNAYAFVVSYKDDWKEKRSHGMARHNVDDPRQEMSTSVHFHTASVSKTITGAAILKVLNKRSIAAGTPIHPYLPAHWSIHNDVKDVSFRDIMTHNSGLRTRGLDYAGLKKVMRDGKDQPPDKAYQGVNFALMRLLIPLLAGYPIRQLKKANYMEETIQASEYAHAYIDYVNKEIFAKAGLSTLHCNANGSGYGKCYHFPHLGNAGEDFGDQTMKCGSQGWVMSAAQLAKFFRQLNFTENIMSSELSNTMRNSLVGYDTEGKTGKGISYYTKGGFYPGKQNAGELRTRVMGYDNGVSIAVIINSNFIKTKETIAVLNDALDSAIS